MSLRIEYQCTTKEMQEAASTVLRRVWRRPKWVRAVLSWIIFVSLAIVLSHLYSHASSGGVTRQAPLAVTPPPDLFYDVIGPLLPWVLCLLMLWLFFRPMRARRSSGGIVDELLTGSADDNALSIAGPSYRTEFAWSAFRGFDEAPSVFVLYQDEPAKAKFVRFWPIPKRAFGTPERLAEFEGLLHARINPFESRFPVIHFPDAHSEQRSKT